MSASGPLLSLVVEVAEPIEIGSVGGLVRRFVPIVGGRVSGAHSGRILPAGGDWQTVAPDGQLDLEARYVLDLEDGLVEVLSQGLRYAPPHVQEKLARGEAPQPGEVYFRTAMRFWTASPKLARLNHVMAMASGRRLAFEVHLQVFEAS